MPEPKIEETWGGLTCSCGIDLSLEQYAPDTVNDVKVIVTHGARQLYHFWFFADFLQTKTVEEYADDFVAGLNKHLQRKFGDRHTLEGWVV